MFEFVLYQTLPFRALNTQAMAKKPIPTEANPHPATSSYLKAPSAINESPTIIIIKVAHAKTVFLFIPIIVFRLVVISNIVKNQGITPLENDFITRTGKLFLFLSLQHQEVKPNRGYFENSISRSVFFLR